MTIFKSIRGVCKVTIFPEIFSWLVFRAQAKTVLKSANSAEAKRISDKCVKLAWSLGFVFFSCKEGFYS